MSSKIKILDASLVELATIAVASSAVRTEKINGDNTLNFTLRIKDTAAAFINETNVVELDGDYFDIAYYKKEQQGNGKLLASVECEHVSYRLNASAYNVATFTEIGTPTAILAAILAGTGFTVGTVDFTDTMTFSLQEATSRRALLMQLAAYVGGELEFLGFNISLRTQRGSATPTALIVGKDVAVISKAVDKRKLDGSGNPTVSYTCGVYKGAALNLGDVVTLDYDALGISTSLRVVSKSYDPYNPNNVSVEIGNYVNSLEDDLYRIETDMVAKGKTYYGARISAESGFESIRSDNLARAVFNADLFSMQVWDEALEGWKNKLYFDPATGTYVFDGELSASLITALEAQFDVTISNTVIVNQLSADKGNIAELTVDRLDTSDKVQNYLAADTGDVNYIRIADQTVEFVAASTTGATTEQITDRNSNPVYWLDDTHTGTTLEVTEYPVLTYVYTEDIKAKITFEDIDGTYTPKIILGAGWLTEDEELREQAQIYKGTDGLVINHIGADGKEALIQLKSYVDATMRRISTVAINKTAGTIAVTAEGESSPTTINYTETATSMTFTWPDSHSATISIS
jgi:hypothetical protein